MSHLKHATVSAWQRDHDGNYTAELHGHVLKVAWQPAHGHQPRGFVWEAVRPDGSRAVAHESHEEIEIAMAEAEAAASPPDEAGEAAGHAAETGHAH